MGYQSAQMVKGVLVRRYGLWKKQRRHLEHDQLAKPSSKQAQEPVSQVWPRLGRIPLGRFSKGCNVAIHSGFHNACDPLDETRSRCASLISNDRLTLSA